MNPLSFDTWVDHFNNSRFAHRVLTWSELEAAFHHGEDPQMVALYNDALAGEYDESEA